MTSYIKVQRICKHCGNEFTARTTVTQYCTETCAKRAYKVRLKAKKIESSNNETQQIRNKPIEDLKAKEFLTVREVARLLNCSVRLAYYYVGAGKIKSVNLGQRVTRVKRSEIDKLFQ
jgi:excisionase family DNA binding protein